MSNLVGLNLIASEALRAGDTERLRLCLRESLNPEMTLRCIYETKEYGLLGNGSMRPLLNTMYIHPELRHKIYLDLLVRKLTEESKLFESGIDKNQLYNLMVENEVNIFSLRGYRYTNVDLRLYFDVVLKRDAHALFLTMEVIFLTLGENSVVDTLTDMAVRKHEGRTGEIMKHLIKKGKGELFASACLVKIRRLIDESIYLSLLRNVCSLCPCPMTLADAFCSMKSFSEKVFFDLVRAFNLPLTDEQKREWEQHSPQYYTSYFQDQV